jgi:hypothetical protein
MENLQENSLNWAITHIRKFGDTDIFPVPFEYTAIHQQWDLLKSYLLGIDLETHETRAYNRYLVPKPQGGYRVAIQLDPIDTLLYTATVYEAADNIENYRISIDQKISCSYRVQKDVTGQLFKPNSGWDDFQERSQVLVDSGEFSYVLVADITDFYNQVGHHRIENALEAAGVPSSRAKAIERFLGNLTAKQSRGIPVGPSASILLAEVCLSDVDSFLVRGGYVHSRYVDDFRIFCKSLAQAEKALHDLSDYLYTAHRLSLQSHKTKIIGIEEFKDEELFDPEKLEEQSKAQKILEQLFLLGKYDSDEAQKMEPAELRKLVRQNLSELFDLCLEKTPLNLGLARYLLRKATQSETAVLQEQVINNIPQLLPVLRDAMTYLYRTTQAKNHELVGGKLIEFLNDSHLAFIPYVKLWITHILTEKFAENFETPVLQFCRQENDNRYLALLAKRRNYLDWVRAQKEVWNNYSPWQRRAIIWSAPVLPADERKHWLKSIENAGDKLDYIVAKASYK